MRVKRSTFIIVTAVLGVAVLALAGAGVWLHQDGIRHKTMLENTYKKSFFDLTQGLDDIDVKLKKINLASGREYQNELLSEVWRLADVAQANLATLSGKINKYCNCFTLFRFIYLTGNSCNYYSWTIFIPNIVLNNQNRSYPTLFTSNNRTKVCVI